MNNPFLNSLDLDKLKKPLCWLAALAAASVCTWMMDRNLVLDLYSLRSMRIQDTFSVLLLTLVFALTVSRRHKIRDVLLWSLFSGILAFCQWVGMVYSAGDSWEAFVGSPAMAAKSLLFIFGWFLPALAVTLLISDLLALILPVADGKKGRRSLTMGSCFLRIFLVLTLCWLPWYLICWPGTVHPDCIMQFLQVFHIPTRFQSRQVTDGVNILFSNDHSVLYTWLVGIFLKLGRLAGNINLGIALYCFLQMLVCAASVSVLSASLYHFGLSRKAVRVLTVVYGLFPPFAVYSFFICGDVFFVITFLPVVTGLVWIARTRGKIFHTRWFIPVMILALFLLAASKNQGVYIAAACFPIMFFLIRRERKYVVLTFLVPLLVYQFLYTGILFDLCHVAPVGRQEGLSFFFQQTARFVKYHGEEVEAEEQEAIDAVLNYELLADKYDPNLSDPVKSTFRAEASSDEMAAYFRAWASMGLRHPDTYAEAFLSNTYGYYTLDYGPYDQTSYFTLNNLSTYEKDRKWVTRLIRDGTISEDMTKLLNYTPPAKLAGVRKLAATLLRLSRSIPLVSLFQMPGAIVWVTVLILMFYMVRRDWTSFWTFFPAFLIFGVCLLSPKNSNFRYMLPDSFLLPALAASAVGLAPLPREAGKKEKRKIKKAGWSSLKQKA